MSAKKQKARSSPMSRWLMFWLLVMANVALVAAIFGNVDVRTLKDKDTNATSSDQEISAMREQITSLKNTLDDAESQIAAEKNPTYGCQTENFSKIDNYLNYTDEEKTIKVTIPYSTGWQNPDCTPLAPAYVGSGSSISFGPSIVTGEGIAEIVRDSNLVVLPKITLDELKLQLSKQKTGDEAKVSNIQIRTVNGLTVYSYKTEYIIGTQQTIWYALGRNFTYKLTSSSWLTDAEAIKIIQSLRVTK